MTDIPEDIQEINNRIAAIKAKSENKQDKKKTASEAYPQVVMAFQIALELVSGVIVGAGIGYILDELFDFKFICLLIFTIFGGFAGLLNVFRYLKKADEENKGE